MNTRTADPESHPDSTRRSRVSRRTAVKLALVGIAGAAVGVTAPPLLRSLTDTPPRRYRFFTDDEAGLVIDLCEQLIPADDAPGATETGAVDFIDRQLTGRLRRHQQAYRRGLESLRRTCTQTHGKEFHQLASAQKIELLQAIEAGKVPAELWAKPSAPAFFNLVLAHTLQSFYGSPRHGGNRGYASYRMLGLDMPPIAGQNRHPKA